MNSYLKTCVMEILLLVALAAPAFVGGCERQSEPPVEPRSDSAAAGASTQPNTQVKDEDKAAGSTQG